LQQAADRLQRDPTLDLTSLAQEVGYADHAHLTRDFRAVLGFTPSDYRLGALEPSGGRMEPDAAPRAGT
jgi:AraC-like DNA-binding protein